jgi:hypothetical protein
MVSSLTAALLLAAQLDPGALIPLYRQALAEREREAGSDHPKVARSASDLGLYLRNSGYREVAAIHLARALKIDEAAFGPSHPTTAEDMENLASVSSPESALALYRSAAECSDAAISARNWAKVGTAMESKGDLAATTDAYRKALVQEEKARGRNHEKVAVRLNDLAQTLEPRAAEPLIRRALAIEAKALGPNHPAIGVTWNNLANTLLALRRVAEAETAARNSLRILENALGPDQPRVATAAGNLADVLRAKRDLAGARQLYTRALNIDERAYGPEHPEVAADLEKLADLLLEMGERKQAERLRARAAAITASK